MNRAQHIGYRVPLAGCFLFLFCSVTTADIFRWDNGAVIPGTEGVVARIGFPTVHLDGLNVSYAQLTSAYLVDATLVGTSLQSARLDRANLTRANFSRADFRNASMVAVVARFANFTDARIDYLAAHNSDFSNAILIRTGALDCFNCKFTNADLTEANLTGASFWHSDLTGAVLTNAIVNYTNLNFTTPHGLVKEQIYSTASYQAHNLRRVQLIGNDLSGWDFSYQDFTDGFLSRVRAIGADLSHAKLTNVLFEDSIYDGTDFSSADLTGADFIRTSLIGADFTGAQFESTNLALTDLRRATGLDSLAHEIAPNAIRPDGRVVGLNLAQFADNLIIRDLDMEITVVDQFRLAPQSGTLEFMLHDRDWASTVVVAAGVTPQLGGTLRLTLDPNVDPYSLLGATFDLFDWPTPLTSGNRFRTIEMTAKSMWDLSNLYTTGEAKLIAVPEPDAFALAAIGILALISTRRRRNGLHRR